MPVSFSILSACVCSRTCSVSSSSVVTSIKLTDEERRTAQKAAKAMGLPVCGVDMMRSARGPLVLEVNSSPGFGIETVTGHNVGEKIIEYIEQTAKAGRRKDKIGA